MFESCYYLIGDNKQCSKGVTKFLKKRSPERYYLIHNKFTLEGVENFVKKVVLY